MIIVNEPLAIGEDKIVEKAGEARGPDGQNVKTIWPKSRIGP